jgi:cellulose synthase/poly-beta-1,6-N-acetylglucosamine synthase-like glycosyltransferase
MNLSIILTVALGLYLIATFWLHIYGLNSYLMVALFLRSKRKRLEEDGAILDTFWATKSDSDLPVVTTQLPIYNEQNVVERLLRSIATFDYPRDKHEIQLLDDSTDETRETAARLVAELKQQGYDIHHIHREQRDGYKAGALRDGLAKAKGEFIAIFDADFVPPTDFLRNTIPFLVTDDRCGFVQTRWGHRNRTFSPLTFLQSIGIDGHFVVEQPARAWNGLFFNFNGTAGVWRREAIEKAGGWMADTLTEDLDLSYRCLLAEYHARYLLNVVTPAEIPTNINALKSQQRRWAKGSIQTAIKLLPIVWRRPDIGRFKKIQSAIHLTHYLIHPLILLITVLILPLVALAHVGLVSAYTAPILALMFLALCGPSTMYVFSQGIAEGKWRRTILYVPAMMALGIGLAVNNTRAVIEGITGRSGEFVRTPKLGSAGEKSASRNRPSRGRWTAYRQPLGKLYWAELLMGAWAFAAFFGGLSTLGSIAGPFLLIQAVGFTAVGIISVIHDKAFRG